MTLIRCTSNIHPGFPANHWSFWVWENTGGFWTSPVIRDNESQGISCQHKSLPDFFKSHFHSHCRIQMRCIQHYKMCQNGQFQTTRAGSFAFSQLAAPRWRFLQLKTTRLESQIDWTWRTVETDGFPNDKSFFGWSHPLVGLVKLSSHILFKQNPGQVPIPKVTPGNDHSPEHWDMLKVKYS